MSIIPGLGGKTLQVKHFDPNFSKNFIAEPNRKQLLFSKLIETKIHTPRIRVNNQSETVLKIKIGSGY